MAQKKYQVFISSTYKDLIEERKKVQERLLMADCIPAGMEAFVAANDEQFEVIKKVIDLCDYYVLIIGKRYGSINQKTGLSYTEMEYDYAVSQKIPVLVFAIDDNVNLQDDKVETNPIAIEKLKCFKEKAMKNRLASIWKDKGDLAGNVAISIMKAKEEILRPGWLRGNEINTEEVLIKYNKLQEENKLITEKNIELQNRITELTAVNEDLEFKDSLIRIDFYLITNLKKHESKPFYKNMFIKDIFAYVSLFMNFAPVDEDELNHLILMAVTGTKYSFLMDEALFKKLSLQFIALNLMNCYADTSRNKVLYKLTTKGLKIREELNTFKKQKNNLKSTGKN